VGETSAEAAALGGVSGASAGPTGVRRRPGGPGAGAPQPAGRLPVGVLPPEPAVVAHDHVPLDVVAEPEASQPEPILAALVAGDAPSSFQMGWARLALWGSSSKSSSALA